jgi:membrane-bound inhibitor of C-type lysozyme
MKKNITFFVLLLIIIAVAGIWYVNDKGKKSSSPLPSLIAEVTYICKGDKTINAAFYQGEIKKVEPGQMPIPSGSAKIVLSDGRNFDLPETISADGARYANSDESFVFWSRGNGALILENNAEKSYIGCLIFAKDPGGLPKVYLDDKAIFSVRYPEGYSVNASYKYQALGPGKDINGIKLIIPVSLASGTNLSGYDTGVSVEEIPGVQECNAGIFLYPGAVVQNINDNNVDYSIATQSDAGAGNFYEEKVWAMPGTNPCIAVRYFIHSTNIGNYDPGTVKEFNHSALIDQFDRIRRTLILN